MKDNQPSDTTEPTERPVETTSSTPTQAPVNRWHQPVRRRTLLWVLLAGLIVILFLSMAAAFFHEMRSSRIGSDGLYGSGQTTPLRGYHRNNIYQSAPDSSQTSSTHIVGVVSAVSGDTITVIGNGTSKTVKTTDQTVYNTAAKKVNVNDSVVIDGITSGDVFTADSIAITNR